MYVQPEGIAVTLPFWVGVLLFIEVLSSCYEVIKDILLLFKDSLLMPVVTILPCVCVCVCVRVVCTCSVYV